MVIRIGLVGVGKIARDQHIPALLASPDFEIAATASRSGEGIEGRPAYREIGDMLTGEPDLEAVTLCTPPEGRDALAMEAMEAGLHVMLEKPPGTSTGQVEALESHAIKKGVTLFATWHSREAGAVDPAREWLATKRIDSAHIVWKEDIRRWHPGQEWILGPGGFGVFDPGINALSIATAILPGPFVLEASRIEVPEGRASPIAATLQMRAAATRVTADFDFRQTGPQCWNIIVETDAGTLRLEEGGSVLKINDDPAVREENREYPRLYQRFADLVRRKAQDVDVAPLRIVTEALARANRVSVPAFQF